MFQDFIHFAVNSPLGIIGWVAIIVVVFFFWPLGRKWLISFIVLLFLALWLWNSLVSAVDSAQREVSEQVDSATSAASEWIPDWMKDLWQWAKGAAPSPEEAICEYRGISLACDILKELKAQVDQVTKDAEDTEAICKASPVVEQKFGDAGKVKFCTGFAGPNAQRAITAIAKGVVQGVISNTVPEYFLPKSKSLETNQYLQCLNDSSTQVPGANSSSCTYTDPHLWRLCVEFHMQLPSEELGQPPAPLEPKIQACRDAALKAAKP